MEREVGAQRVRRDPADALAEVRREGGRDLLAERERDEQDGDPDEHGDIGATDRAVDERAQQLRRDELQRDARRDEDAEE